MQIKDEEEQDISRRLTDSKDLKESLNTNDFHSYFIAGSGSTTVFRSGTSLSKFALATLLATICVIAVVTNTGGSYSEDSNYPLVPTFNQRRILSSVQLYDSSLSLSSFNKLSNNNIISSSGFVTDEDKRLDEVNKVQVFNSLTSPNMDYRIEILKEFLRKKRLEYTIRLNKKKLDEEAEKIQYIELIKQLEQSSLCLRNENYVSSDVLVDEDLSLDLDEFKENKSPPALLPKSNLKHSNIIQAKDSFLEPNIVSLMSLKNKNLFTDVKSMFCMNYITSGGVDFFNNYFMDKSKAEDKIKFSNGKEKGENDMYLHMLIPSNHHRNITHYDNDERSYSFKNKTDKFKQVYYEVGCRVLELNKIYK